MWRKMRRWKQQLTDEECVKILKEEPRGVLAINGDDGYPYALPLDFIYDEEDGRLYFHCAKEGAKIDLLKKSEKVSFCVMDQGYRKEGEWALNIKSVIIFGRIELVTDQERAIDHVRKLGMKYSPTVEYVEEEIKNAASRVQMLALTIEHMTGKLVNES